VQKGELIKLLNEDLALAFRSHVQTISNLTGADNDDTFEPTCRQRLDHLDRQLEHTMRLARQIDWLGGLPTTEVSPVHWTSDTRMALAEEMALESLQLNRLRNRASQAREIGETGVAEAIETIARDSESQLETLSEVLTTTPETRDSS